MGWWFGGGIRQVGSSVVSMTLRAHGKDVGYIFGVDEACGQPTNQACIGGGLGLDAQSRAA